MQCQECGTIIEWEHITEMFEEGYDIECPECGSEDLDL